MRTSIFVLVFFMAFASSSTGEVSETFSFETSSQKQRFYTLTNLLRCLECQNQSIADSNAAIAQDLRQEVHRLIVEGKDDDAVIEFVLSRYGEFAVYNPRFEAKTLMLWLGPLFFLLMGLIVLIVVVRNHSAPPDEKPNKFSDKTL